MDDRHWADFRAVERWLHDNDAEAERWLPRLLELDGPGLRQELNGTRSSGPESFGSSPRWRSLHANSPLSAPTN